MNFKSGDLVKVTTLRHDGTSNSRLLLVLKKVSKSRKHHYPLSAFLDEPPCKKETIYEALYDNGKRVNVGLQDYKIADIELKHKLLQSVRQKQGE